MASNKGKKSSGGGESFFQKLFGSLFGSNDPEAEKKRQLKNISKIISKAKFKFYKPKTEEALPAFGRLIWDLYKAISPVQLMFMSNENPNYFKNSIFMYSLTDEQREIYESLSVESLDEMATKMSYDALSKKVKSDLEILTSAFDMEKITMIDDLYTKLIRFKEFCMFDYYFILKKYDSSLQERNFSGSPKLNPINASYILDDLKDFADLVYTLPVDEPWVDLMKYFREAKGSEPIKAGLWQKILLRVNAVKLSGVLEMMIQLIVKDPSYMVNREAKSEHIVEGILDKVRKEALEGLKKLEKQLKNSKVDGLLAQIFSNTNFARLKNYTEQRGENFDRRGLGSFEYAQPLNYLKEFLVEYAKKDIRIYSDIILVRGQWVTSALSAPMSDAYNSLLSISDKITEFDEKFAEDKDVGLKLKTLSPRLERDKEAQNIVRTTLKDMNGIAREYILQATKDFITYGKNVKALLEDCQKKEPDMVINWKELTHYAENNLDEGTLQELGVNVYKKIYLFANLMQQFIK